MALVLVVDNDAGLPKAIAEALALESGHSAIIANGGNPAWEAYQNANPKPDVIVTDFGMPNGGGVDLIKRIRAANPQADIIMFTGAMDVQIESAGGEWFLNEAQNPGSHSRLFKKGTDPLLRVVGEVDNLLARTALARQTTPERTDAEAVTGSKGERTATYENPATAIPSQPMPQPPQYPAADTRGNGTPGISPNPGGQPGSDGPVRK